MQYWHRYTTSALLLFASAPALCATLRLRAIHLPDLDGIRQGGPKSGTALLHLRGGETADVPQESSALQGGPKSGTALVHLRGGETAEVPQESSALQFARHAVASTLNRVLQAAAELLEAIREWPQHHPWRHRALAVVAGLLDKARCLVTGLSKSRAFQLPEALRSRAFHIPQHVWIPWQHRALALVAASLVSPALLPDWWACYYNGEMPVALLLQRNMIVCLVLLVVDHIATNFMCRGKATEAFSPWPQLSALRYVSHTAGPDKKSISAIFVRASALSTPLWFKAVVTSEAKCWYWTPYAQHEESDWMPVSETKVDTKRRFLYQGRTPAWYNVRLIRFLCEHESETAAAVPAELLQ